MILVTKDIRVEMVLGPHLVFKVFKDILGFKVVKECKVLLDNRDSPDIRV